MRNCLSLKIAVIFIMTLLVSTNFIVLYDSNVQARVSLHHKNQNENVNWVLMFYQNGDNKLSPYIEIIHDLIEFVGATDDIKIAVLIDKNQLNDTKLYYYEGKTPVEQDWPVESDMGDPETLIQFAEKVMNDLPSEHYCLEITANKGSGWQGISYDKNGDGIMITMPEIHYALDTITDNGCIKLDVLLIQTCLGGNHEFQYQVSQFCDYYVSYADCGLVGDIPFDNILADVVADPSMSGEQFAITVVDHFVPQQIQEIYQAMGAIDSSILNDLSSSIDELAVWLLDNINLYESDIETAIDETRKYGLQFNIDYFVDLKDFLEHLTIDNSDYLEIKNSILNNIESTVIASVTLEGHPSCGFNIYFPNIKEDYNNALRYYHALPSPYEQTLFAEDTNWDEFLKTFLDLTDNTPPEIPNIDGPNNGKPGKEIEYKLSADDPQGDNVCFYVNWDDGTGEWTNLDSPGEEIKVVHTWELEGTYDIRLKSIDQYCVDSDWAELTVTIQKNKAFNFNFNLLQRFLEQFPILQKILLLFQR